MPPLVSVICLCHNHERFVREALQSVIDQTYSNVELIIVDDASTDGSEGIIRQWLASHAHVIFLPLEKNRGICRAFNEGLSKARGAYVIDLAADDRLMPKRIARGVEWLASRPDCGVQFSDAEIIDEKGNRLRLHSDRFPHDTIPQGNVFRDILSRYFINSPTMMMRKKLLNDLLGYDESLAYEDFDFWVRSSQRTAYTYIPEVLVQKRELPTSMGKLQFGRKSAQQRSTYRVCTKAFNFCLDAKDFAALKQRIAYEFRQALRVGRLSLAWDYLMLLRKIPG